MVHCTRIVKYTHRKCQWSKCFHCQKVVWKWSRNSIWHWPYIVYMICRLFLNLIWSLKPAILILGFIIYLYKFVFWFKTIFLCYKFGVFMFGFSSISIYSFLGLFSTNIFHEGEVSENAALENLCTLLFIVRYLYLIQNVF